MRKWFSICCKEWLLLWRDKMGLAIIFILPMMLVFFICLTQPTDTEHSQKYRVLLLDHDKGVIGKAMATALYKVKEFKVTKSNNTNTLQLAKAKVAAGEQQLLIVIPKHASRDSALYFRDLQTRKQTRVKINNPVLIWADSALPAAVADGISLTVDNILQHIELENWRAAARFKIGAKRIVDNNISYIGRSTQYVQVGSSKKPNVLQQNVPAWSLFGMFFIVIPLAGVMVRERSLGIMQRLRLAPVSMFTLYSGRVAAFVVVNLCQLFLMFIMGVTVLPALGLGSFAFMPYFSAMLVIGVCASFAATSFGIMLGNIARTQQQATFLGPFVIVIAAAVGGIFVPVDIMPKILLPWVDASPLHWAQVSFLNIFVRHQSLHSHFILINLLKLVVFALVCLFAAAVLGRLYRPGTRAAS